MEILAYYLGGDICRRLCGAGTELRRVPGWGRGRTRTRSRIVP